MIVTLRMGTIFPNIWGLLYYNDNFWNYTYFLHLIREVEKDQVSQMDFQVSKLITVIFHDYRQFLNKCFIGKVRQRTGI